MKFDKGELIGVYLGSNLNSIYKKLFQNARRGAKRNPFDLEHGIKLIIFGCFLIEAKVNDEVQHILYNQINEEQLEKYLWKSIRRKRLIDKIDLLSKYSTEKQRGRIISLKQKIHELFELRNKLAHFKEEPKQYYDTKPETAELVKLMFNSPPPGINKMLMWENTHLYAKLISETNKWLNDFHRSYNSRVQKPSKNLGLIEVSPDDIKYKMNVCKL